jgi:hypothetical protein
VVAAGACLDAQALACRLLIAVFEAGGVQVLELLDQPVELIGVLGGGGLRTGISRSREHLTREIGAPRSAAC